MTRIWSTCMFWLRSAWWKFTRGPRPPVLQQRQDAAAEMEVHAPSPWAPEWATYCANAVFSGAELPVEVRAYLRSRLGTATPSPAELLMLFRSLTRDGAVDPRHPVMELLEDDQNPILVSAARENRTAPEIPKTRHRFGVRVIRTVPKATPRQD